ncbi:MAG: PEGA domain-containing protein [Acidobacteriaceae bacterium]
MPSRRFLQPLAASVLLIPLFASPQMPPQPAKLIVDSDPPSAAITVNGRKISQRTNATLIVSPGTYTVTVGEKGSATWCAASTATVVSGQTATWSCSGNKWVQAPKS